MGLIAGEMEARKFGWSEDAAASAGHERPVRGGTEIRMPGGAVGTKPGIGGAD
jgi:hypothetical protein